MHNAPFLSSEGQPCLSDKTFSEQSTTQVYSLSQNAVGKTPSSAPFPPSLTIPPSYFCPRHGSGQMVTQFSQNISPTALPYGALTMTITHTPTRSSLPTSGVALIH